MPRTQVRAAIAAYLEAGITASAIPFLAQVFPHPPKLTRVGDFVQGEAPGIASGAVLYLHLRDTDHVRFAGGPTSAGGPTPAKKMKTYQVGMIGYMVSTKMKTQDVGADNDLFLDGLEAWIIRDRNAGTGSPSGSPPGNGSGTIFVWGEAETDARFGKDVVIRAGMPRTKKQGQGSSVFSSIDVIAQEVLDT